MALGSALDWTILNRNLPNSPRCHSFIRHSFIHLIHCPWMGRSPGHPGPTLAKLVGKRQEHSCHNFLTRSYFGCVPEGKLPGGARKQDHKTT